MYRLNWLFCNGSHWFQAFDTEKQALDYAHHCDLLRSHSVDRVWITSNGAVVCLREKKLNF